ncbi:hypothetical protein D3C87_1579340 [compost metagenome]
MAAREGDFTEIFVGAGLEFGRQIVGRNGVARGRVGIGKGKGLALDVLKALIGAVSAHGDHRVVAEIAFVIERDSDRSNVFAHHLAGQGISGRTDGGEVHVPRTHGLDDGCVVGAAHDIDWHAELGAQVSGIGLGAGDGISFILARRYPDGEFGILLPPILGGGDGNEGGRDQYGRKAAAHEGEHSNGSDVGTGCGRR